MTTTTRPIAPPTARALEVLAWIDAYCVRHGYSPTVRDICTAFKWSSTSAATGHIGRLVTRDLVEYQRYMSRTIRLTDHGRQVLAEGAQTRT